MASTSQFRLDGSDAPEAARRLPPGMRRDTLLHEPQEPSLASPCVRNCCLNDDDMCLGCGRLLSEICGWYDATEVQREEILRMARARLVARPAQARSLAR